MAYRQYSRKGQLRDRSDETLNQSTISSTHQRTIQTLSVPQRINLLLSRLLSAAHCGCPQAAVLPGGLRAFRGAIFLPAAFLWPSAHPLDFLTETEYRR